ncbi:MAG: MarR family transcriptional regulator [Myxococcota bacterium]
MSWSMDPADERAFIDQLAMLFERSGIPPVAGRILGRCLVCDPPHQSSQQLADYLNASAGAVSTATRMLVAVGLLERIRLRGSRAMWFQIRNDAWETMWSREAENIRVIHGIAARGRELVATAPPETRVRMEQFDDLYSFLVDAMPKMWAQWKERQR